MKKSISILLVIVMVSGILSGCGIKKATQKIIKKTHRQLRIYIPPKR